jgi:hypothetical protein
MLINMATGELSFGEFRDGQIREPAEWSGTPATELQSPNWPLSAGEAEWVTAFGHGAAPAGPAMATPPAAAK